MEGASLLDDLMATGTVALLLNGLAHVRGRPTNGLLASGDLPLSLCWSMVGDSPRAMLGEMRSTNGLLASGDLPLSLRWPVVGDSPRAMQVEMLGETDLAVKADGGGWAC